MIRDRYRIGRVLGQPGGFGVTYLAFDERLHTRVAIKEYMPRDVAGRATSDGSEVWSSGGHEETFQHGLDQFLREARTLAQFDHSNVVGVSNYFETNGTGYLVMDYYEGHTVAQRLDAEPDERMAPETASGIIEEVANGLREVHAEGYLHRDIKPSNIYLTQEGRPILIDFGAARAALGEHSQSLSVLVSPGYAPYEQYRMRGDQGPHTDVCSCAATLYRMVTGTVGIPVQGKNTPLNLSGTKELALGAGEASPITSRALAATDPDDGAEELQFTVTEGPTRGEIRVGGGSASAASDSSFTQKDIKEGRVFYADTTGEAGVDTLTFAVKDEDGAGPESESFRVKIEPSEAEGNSPDTEENCRIQFAATNEEDVSGELAPEDSVDLAEGEAAEDFRSRRVDITVRYAETKRGVVYGLFSEQAGTRSEMETKLENMEDISGFAFIVCFHR